MACGQSCYLPSEYCCLNGQLTQIQACPASSGSVTPSTSAPNTGSSNSIAVPSVHNDCGGRCQSNTTCCGSDSSCSGNAISQRCCPKTSGFCGCISNRGFCSGQVYGEPFSSETGYDTFGACFDSSKGSCTYDPSPNIWIVCPTGFTACKSASFFTCCNSSTTCTSNIASSYPVCSANSQITSTTPVEASSSTPANTNDNVPSQGNCGAGLYACGNACYSPDDYCCPNGVLTQIEACSSTPAPVTADSNSNANSIAVSSVHNECGSQCRSNSTCCGSDSSCNGNAISQRCCPNSSSFCGCISNRGFCSGQVYGQPFSAETGYDTFGACYDPSKGSCTYDPSPNLWIVCPTGSTVCKSASFFTCCNSSTTCTSNIASSYPVCSANTPAPVANQETTQTSSNMVAVNSVHNECGSQCQSNSTCCGSDSSCSGNVISQRCCPKTSGFCGCISNRAFCQGSVFGQTDRAQGQDTFGTCFDTSKATCTYEPSPNLWVVCPNGFTACKSSSYFTCCNSSQVCTTDTYTSSYPICAAASSVQAPTKAAASASDICAGKCAGSSCCATPSGSQCYDSTKYSCTADDMGNSFLCPSGLNACGGSCYNPSQYRCEGGQLVQQ